MDEAPQSSNVLAYQATSPGGRGGRWWTAALVCAGLSLIVSLGQAFFGLSIAVRIVLAAGATIVGDEEALFWLPVMTIAGAAGVLAAVAGVLLITRRGHRFVPIGFVTAAGVDLLIAAGFMGLCVVERHATGLDQIVVAFGFIFAAAASVAVWLYAGTAAVALRLGREQGRAVAASPTLLWRSIIVLAIAPLVLAVSTYLLFRFLP